MLHDTVAITIQFNSVHEHMQFAANRRLFNKIPIHKAIKIGIDFRLQCALPVPQIGLTAYIYTLHEIRATNHRRSGNIR